jgi:hypothetical protein
VLGELLDSRQIGDPLVVVIFFVHTARVRADQPFLHRAQVRLVVDEAEKDGF